MQISFGTLEISQRIKQDSALMKVHALIDWEGLRGELTGLYKREESRAGGQEPIDPLLMFKTVLLGQLHSLSDAKLEDALQVRIDFIVFCGLGLHENTPDHSTLCRFRNRLINTGKLPKLLAAVNQQLQHHGLMVKQAQGAIVEATLITAAARPRNEIRVDELSSSNAEERADTPEVSCQQSACADPDAAWAKKGKRSYFGYRSHIIVDSDDGYVRGVHSTPANESETTQLQAVLSSSDFQPQRLYADKGYTSQANRDFLRQHKIKRGIMYKAQRNRPLTSKQRRANKLIAKPRALVERCFGTVKRLFDMQRTRYFGTHKINAQFILKAICMNLLKAVNKISLTTPPLQGRCA